MTTSNTNFPSWSGFETLLGAVQTAYAANYLEVKSIGENLATNLFSATSISIINSKSATGSGGGMTFSYHGAGFGTSKPIFTQVDIMDSSSNTFTVVGTSIAKGKITSIDGNIKGFIEHDVGSFSGGTVVLTNWSSTIPTALGSVSFVQVGKSTTYSATSAIDKFTSITISDDSGHSASISGLNFSYAYNPETDYYTRDYASMLIEILSGKDTVNGSASDDELKTFSGDDVLNGLAGNDVLDGGAGNDTLAGGSGNDTMDGGEGSDLYVIALAGDYNTGDVIQDTGASGTDEVRFTSATASTLTLESSLIGIETVVIGTGTGATAVTTATTALNIDAALVTTTLSITGNAGNNSLTGGLGNDTLTGGAGADTFTVTSGTDTITDLGKKGADILIVASAATANATVTTAWTATSFTTNAGTANISTNGLAVNLAAATGANGYSVTNTGAATTLTGSRLDDVLTGGVGKDTLVGSAGNDTLTGGKGADSLTGGSGTDTFVFTTGDSGQTASFDIIRDYFKGAVGTGDLIDFSANLTIGGSDTAATATQALINQDTGIATFAAGSGKKLGDALLDIATRFTAATNTSGEFSFFKVNNTGDYYLYISDGVAGVTADDDVIQLVGVSSISSIDLTGGNLTITG